jgi:uncharacterized membrane protein SpoIIM required for sporulation
MREAAFSKQNHEKWRAFEQKTAPNANTHPDELAELFIEITDDLAFAQTYYPQSKTTQYLNQLAVKAHQTIYRNKREKTNRVLNFWKYEIPLALYQARKPMLLSLIIFVVAIVAGIVSTLNDAEFPRYIMGDRYINTTLDNIHNGDPLGIYGTSAEGDMFISITLHNIKVSLAAIAMGLLLSVFTYMALLNNGIMVGVFFTFLYTEGQLNTALSSVLIHGVIELSSIIIAGGAGILLGNSILFPGTYSRLESFKNGGRIAAKIAVGLVPLFVMAGFLESFVTRHYQNIWVGIITIGITSPFIIWYYIIFPKITHLKYAKQN